MTLASEAKSSGLTLPDKQHTIRYAEGSPAPTQLADGITMSVEPDNDNDESDEGLIWNDDGSVTVNDTPEKPKKSGKKKFDVNLAEDMDETELNIIASDLLEAIAADIDSRREWQETFNRGIDLLGLKIESPTSDVTGGGNISKVKDPLLLEAVLRYQSNFNAEMLPADGPVKVRDDKVSVPVQPTPPGSPPPDPMLGHNGGPPMGGLPEEVSRNELADAFQKDFNKYLTVIDTVYVPDTDRMSFSQSLGGCAFKKIYRDPIEERPISRFVMAPHLIVNNGASSLHDAKRITHEIPAMSKNVFMQMVEAGAYLDVDLSEPVSDPGSADAKIAEIQGTKPRTDRPEDRDYTIYECYCYLNFEDETKPPRPYRVSLEKDSRVVLEIRRDWREKDKQFKRRRHFVKYSMFPGLGFYDYGYVHILGNTTRVLSAIESLMVDSGMFANFPGGLIDKMAARQETSQIRPGPGGFKPIDTGGRPIQQVVMSLPYKDVSPNLMALAKGLQEGGQKLGSIAELPIGEGRADMPVGTVLALIEQSKILESAVHRRNFASQHEEFAILKELFAEDPAALVKLAKNPAREWEVAEEFEDFDLIPMADPNTSSKIQRIGKATALMQIAQQTPPGILDTHEILNRVFKEMELDDIQALFLPPPAPGSQPPPPHVADAAAKQAQIMAKVKADEENNQTKLQIANIESNDAAANRAVQLQESQDRLRAQAMKDAQEFQKGITPPDSMAPPMGGGAS